MPSYAQAQVNRLAAEQSSVLTRAFTCVVPQPPATDMLDDINKRLLGERAYLDAALDAEENKAMPNATLVYELEALIVTMNSSLASIADLEDCGPRRDAVTLAAKGACEYVINQVGVQVICYFGLVVLLVLDTLLVGALAKHLAIAPLDKYTLLDSRTLAGPDADAALFTRRRSGAGTGASRSNYGTSKQRLLGDDRDRSFYF
jgi:hypothetical protein